MLLETKNHKIDLKGPQGPQGPQETLKYPQVAAGDVCKVERKIDLDGSQGPQETLKYPQAVPVGICEVEPKI